MTVGSRIAAALVGLPAPRTADVSVERDLAAKMPDGAVLLADRWFPTAYSSDAPSLPTVLVRTPYGRRIIGPLARLYAERGYQVVVQSCRGTFGSEGDWSPVRNEQADGHATLAWVAGQPWFDGRLVMWGASYLGMTQWAVAEDAPDFLKALSLQVTASNLRDSVVYPGGAFALETAMSWLHQLAHQERGWREVLRAGVASAKVVATACEELPIGKCDAAVTGATVDFYQDWLAHAAPGDDWWDPVDFGRRLDKVPPASLIGGWYDIFLPAQVADYEALRRAGRVATLTIGPWTHSSPGLFAETVRDGPRWFDRQLGAGHDAGGTAGGAAVPVAGGDTGSAGDRAPVRVYVMGSRSWQEFSMWPPAGESRRWYLGRWGTLGTEPPASSAPDRYHYNPHDPTPASGGPSLNFRTAGRRNQRRREHRHDVLTYTSPVLTEDLTVIGDLVATLWLRSSLEHTDFFVRLCDVDEKGRSINLSDGIVRLWPGAVDKDGEGVFRLDVTMWPTANTFRAGHRIRLQVSSGAHPLFCRNAGTGEPQATGSNLRSADQEVFHDPDRPSSITLPVVRLASDGLGGATPR
jgi:uncharacterized protein